MNDYGKAVEAILKGISYSINKIIENAPFDKTKTAIIKKINENNTYDILMQNTIYTNVPSIFKGFLVNDTVKVKIPQKQDSLMYITGKFNMDIKGGGGISGAVTSVNGKVGDVVVKESDNNYTTQDKEIVNNAKEHIVNQNNPHNVTKEQLGLDKIDYNSLINLPTVPTKTSEITNDSNFISDDKYVHTDNNYTTSDKNKLKDMKSHVQADWNVTDTTNDAYIKNKPNMPKGSVVIDNLTSNEVNSSLSANQGRVLNNKIKNKNILSLDKPINQEIGDVWYEIIKE